MLLVKKKKKLKKKRNLQNKKKHKMSKLHHDQSDNFRRMREGGQTQVYENNYIFDGGEDNEKIFMKECKKLLDSLGYDRNLFQKIEPMLRKIEREQNCICPTGLILSMKFTVNLKSFSLLPFPKNQFMNYLKKEWEIIDSLGTKHFEQQNLHRLSNTDYIRFKICKSKISPSPNLERYIAIWKREVYLHNTNVKRKQIEMINRREKNLLIREHFKNLELKINQLDYVYLENLQRIKANNGENACWINTVLFVFFSHHQLRDNMMFNRFFKKEDVHYIEKLIDHTWDDRLYKMYYQLFDENCSDITDYGEFGSPHYILSFIIDDIMNHQQDILKIDMDFDIQIDTVSKLKNKMSDPYLYGIIKGTGVIDINEDDIDMELDSSHFVSFVRKYKSPSEWLYFDAMRGGVIQENLVDENVFFCDKESNQNLGNQPYYFIYVR